MEKYEKITGEKYQLNSNELENEEFFSSLKEDTNSIEEIEENSKSEEEQDIEFIDISFDDEKSL